MDMTYTDASHVDVGELRGFRLDVEEGDERNDFELSLDIASPIRIQERALVYAFERLRPADSAALVGVVVPHDARGAFALAERYEMVERTEGLADGDVRAVGVRSVRVVGDGHGG